MQYDNNSRGVLFKNDRKEKETHPDYKGSYTDANGAEFWLSAWIKKDKNGNAFMSLSTTAKDEAHNKGMQQARQAMAPQPQEPFSDDIPF
jgi:hypothetical protein